MPEKKFSEMTLLELRDYLQEHIKYFSDVTVVISRKRKAREHVGITVRLHWRGILGASADSTEEENAIDLAIGKLISEAKEVGLWRM